MKSQTAITGSEQIEKKMVGSWPHPFRLWQKRLPKQTFRRQTRGHMCTANEQLIRLEAHFVNPMWRVVKAKTGAHAPPITQSKSGGWHARPLLFSRSKKEAHSNLRSVHRSR